jgi:hypothetical protein
MLPLGEHQGVSQLDPKMFRFLLPTLPRGVHFFCLPKRNEPKKKAPDIALIPKINLV